MRKFGTNKKNPNPPWPNQQSVVTIPPSFGTQASDVPDLFPNGRELKAEETELISPNEQLTMSEEDIVSSQPIMNEESERELRRDPIMGVNTQNFAQGMSSDYPQLSVQSRMCEKMTANILLCSHIGKYVKLEFLFGENTHMEKIGLLHSVGKDFISIKENGTNNIIVCATNKIKFINIFNFEK